MQTNKRAEKAGNSPENPLVIYGSNIFDLPTVVPACGRCRHRVEGRSDCGHPQIGSWDFDFLRARPVLRQGQSIAMARGNGGLCGPEGKLFEKQTVNQSPTPYFVGSATLGIAASAGVWLVTWWMLLLIIPAFALYGQGVSKQ